MDFNPILKSTQNPLNPFHRSLRDKTATYGSEMWLQEYVNRKYESMSRQVKASSQKRRLTIQCDEVRSFVGNKGNKQWVWLALNIEPRSHSGTAAIAASAGILAGLTLKRDFINQVLRREIMQQSVIYQEWKEEFLQEGRQEGEARLVLRLLSHRIGDVSPELRSQIQSLPLTQLEDLGEALLDFKDGTDLEDWLRTLGA